jgi:hypothetical protein
MLGFVDVKKLVQRLHPPIVISLTMERCHAYYMPFSYVRSKERAPGGAARRIPPARGRRRRRLAQRSSTGKRMTS